MGGEDGVVVVKPGAAAATTDSPLRVYRREREALESERDEAAQSAAAYKQLAEKAAANPMFTKKAYEHTQPKEIWREEEKEGDSD